MGAGNTADESVTRRLTVPAPSSTEDAAAANWTVGRAARYPMSHGPLALEPPPDFTLTTSPTSTTAGRGETVTYTMVIDGKNGFSSPVTLELTASALFVTRTYDFGTYDPPFPRTIQYPFTVPDYIPPGVTVDGTLRATGGGLVRENRLTLRVE